MTVKACTGCGDSYDTRDGGWGLIVTSSCEKCQVFEEKRKEVELKGENINDGR